MELPLNITGEVETDARAAVRGVVGGARTNMPQTKTNNTQKFIFFYGYLKTAWMLEDFWSYLSN